MLNLLLSLLLFVQESELDQHAVDDSDFLLKLKELMINDRKSYIACQSNFNDRKSYIACQSNFQRKGQNVEISVMYCLNC